MMYNLLLYMYMQRIYRKIGYYCLISKMSRMLRCLLTENFKTEGAVKRRHDTSCAYDITGIGTLHAFHILATPPMSIPYHHHRQLHAYHYQQQLQQQHSNHLHLQFINSTTSCQYYFHALPHERVKLTFLQMQLETRNQKLISTFILNC